ncbi:tyrosine--tRNA ligase [Candidatus Pacearchaeota archaeon]|nr:tyrosine--tRNA ligase [Candidatus Pacearchaeota archaeon]
MDIKEKLKLIKRNTAEIIGEEELSNLLKTKKKPVIYWGTAPTGKPHIGYFLPALKVADFLKAGFKAIILLADLHAALDNTPWNILEKRYDYYSKIIPAMIRAIGVESKDLEFIKGSDFQLKPEYMYDVLQLSSMVSVHDAHKAASEVVKLGDNPKLSGLIYPIMQVLDEQYLGIDAQLGGTDQRKIMVLARESLPKLGYEKRIEVMNPLIPGLIGKKMSASDPKSKIDLLDSEQEVKEKINSAECVAGEVNNGVLAFLKYVIMVIKSDKKEKFIVKRPEKYGGGISYSSYGALEKDFKAKKLHPADLKTALAEEVSKLLKEIQKDKSLFELAKKAYPSE